MAKSLEKIDEKLRKEGGVEIEKLRREKGLFRKIEKIDQKYIKDDKYFTEPPEIKHFIKHITLFILNADAELDSLIDAWIKMKALIVHAENIEKQEYCDVKDKYGDRDKEAIKKILDDVIFINMLLAKNIDKKRKRLDDFLNRCKHISAQLARFSEEVDIDIHQMIEDLT
jgi:hemerythrin superfamily protein